MARRPRCGQSASLRAATERRPDGASRGKGQTTNEQQEEGEQQQEEEPQCECDDERRKTTSAVSPNRTFLLPAECAKQREDMGGTREPSAAEVATGMREQLAAADVEEAWLDADSSGLAAPSRIATSSARGADRGEVCYRRGADTTELAASVAGGIAVALRDALPRDLLSASSSLSRRADATLRRPLCAMIAPENHPELVLEERVVTLRDWANALLALPEARQRDDVRAFFLGEQMGTRA